MTTCTNPEREEKVGPALDALRDSLQAVHRGLCFFKECSGNPCQCPCAVCMDEER